MSKVFLIGFRGAGKTTVGKLWAQNKNARFADMDEIIASEERVPVSEFIEKNGLELFRRREKKLLQSIIADQDSENNSIIATGGGIVDHPESLEILAQMKFPKVYLEVTPNALWARLSADPERLRVGEIYTQERMLELYLRRESLFRKIATYTVQNRDISETLKAVQNFRFG